MKNLSITDVLGILVCWTGAGAITYFSKEFDGVGIVGIFCAFLAYYLSKLIITH